MKRSTYSRSAAWAIVLVFVLSSCDFDAMNTDPNNPTAVPSSALLPHAEMTLLFSELGADPQWYTSVFVQHTTGVHAQLHDADHLTRIDNTTLNNSWLNIYATILPDLKVIIDQASAEEQWNYVGIAKVLKALTYQHTTDLWGRVPFSQATLGADVTTPPYDDQAYIYEQLPALLDEAISDLQKPSVVNADFHDLIYGGNADLWIRTAYGLKARIFNRLSRRDPQASATAALAAVERSFVASSQDFVFTGYSASATQENPWFQEFNDRGHLAWSARMHHTLIENDDPRFTLFAQPLPGTGEIVPAPNGVADLDQAGNLYSKVSSRLIRADAPQPVITYGELLFIKAEALFRLDRIEEARAAFHEAVKVALKAAGVSEEDAGVYLARPAILPVNLTLERILEEKWIYFFPFQPAEAYSDWRRTGFPALSNPAGQIPRRFPIAQRELDSNGDNARNVPITSGVWWDDGTED